jgi:hypothetical protein
MVREPPFQLRRPAVIGVVVMVAVGLAVHLANTVALTRLVHHQREGLRLRDETIALRDAELEQLRAGATLILIEPTK